MVPGKGVLAISNIGGDCTRWERVRRDGRVAPSEPVAVCVGQRNGDRPWGISVGMNHSLLVDRCTDGLEWR
ncbi:hypothetical protein QCA50_019954 [Cerrena zonata]|uniref:Uncharacterized protein n=1 Tax=Cerrena zonata TaxID=2478898 RepID=A0AAW0FI83_9APHY